MNEPHLEIVERTYVTRARRKAGQLWHRIRARPAGEPGGEPVRVGLIGLGNIAEWAYLPLLRESTRFRLTAVYDVVEKVTRSVAESFDARACGSAAEAATAADVDAVLVCTPDRYHCGAALQALRAGKHVLCEKPLAFSLEEAREMWRAARDSGTVAMVNFSCRFQPEVRILRQLLHQGTIGRVYHLSGSLSQGKWFTDQSEPSNERQDAKAWKFGSGGGVVNDLGPHLVDMMGFWIGEITQVQACTASYRPDPMISEDACGVILRFAHGEMAVVTLSRWATAYKEHVWFEIHGSEGTIHFKAGSIRLWTRADARWRELLIPPRETDFLDTFHAAIRNRGTGAPDFYDGLKNNAVLDAIFRSAAEGRIVTLSGADEPVPCPAPHL